MAVTAWQRSSLILLVHRTTTCFVTSSVLDSLDISREYMKTVSLHFSLISGKEFTTIRRTAILDVKNTALYTVIQ